MFLGHRLDGILAAFLLPLLLAFELIELYDKVVDAFKILYLVDGLEGLN